MNVKKKHSKEHEKKKESRDAALLKGTEDLLQMGLDLESLEATVESVQRLAQTPPPSPEAERAAACWLGFVELPESAELLLAMEGRASEKELKREIRRSLFRLEQLGLAVAHPVAHSATPPLSKEMDRGFLSPVDPRGDQVIWFVKEEGSGDYFVLSGVINDRGGLVEADAGKVARPAFRDLVERTYRRFSLKMLQADAAWCDRVLHEAYKRSIHRRNPGVAHFPSYRMEISHQLPEAVACPVRALLGEASPQDREDLLSSSGRLLDEGEMARWTLDPEWIAPHREAFRDASDSPLVLSRFQKEERAARALKEACEAIFSGEARGLYAGRLESMAYYFHLEGRGKAARQALALSTALGESTPEGAAALPFVLELTRRSLAALDEAERRKVQEEQGPSLIVKPTER
ncbi:MAG: hypothetical protein L0191_08235 [Acidobacteria bacterium]|nr:hypothetical protein [Acidobacteriota bacterium]